MFDAKNFNPLDLCPRPSSYAVDGHQFTPQEVIQILQAHFQPERLEKIDRALAQRTYQITPVLENIYDEGNINAVVRTAESFGLQSYHIIRSVKTKTQNRISRGAEKWTDGFKWIESADCLGQLKKAGYFVATTHLSSNAIPIYELNACQKIALVIGNEHEGVSAEALALADANVIIPTAGLTQSFNLSVAGALCLHELYRERIRKQGHSGDLSSDHRGRLKASFLHESLRSADHILHRARNIHHDS